MTTQQYINWLNNPYLLTAEASEKLKQVTEQFPYLQSARALYLKSLHDQRSFLYNAELKKTAAYTTDRDVLFDYIVSEEFINYRPLHLESIDVVDEDYIEIRKPEPTLDETIEKRVLETLVYIENQDRETELIHKIDQISKSKIEARQEKADTVHLNTSAAPVEIQELEEKLEVGQPLDFSDKDKFSFTEWLKLTSQQPVERSKEDAEQQPEEVFEITTSSSVSGLEEEIIPEKQKKMELIDKFIEANPKITPSKSAIAPPAIIDRSEDDEPFFMTETLARIYLEQKKYQKAIQAYEILILKYPEKSSLFANRIIDIKKLQEFNNI